MWGHNLSVLVEIGLTDLPKFGGGLAPPSSLVPPALKGNNELLLLSIAKFMAKIRIKVH